MDGGLEVVLIEQLEAVEPILPIAEGASSGEEVPERFFGFERKRFKVFSTIRGTICRAPERQPVLSNVTVGEGLDGGFAGGFAGGFGGAIALAGVLDVVGNRALVEE